MELTDIAKQRQARVRNGGFVRRRPFTILVVDQEADLLRLLRYLLVSAGYVVLEARTGAEALQRMRESPHRIDMLLVDAELPGVRRQALAFRVRAEAPEARVVYMSSLTDGERAGAGLSDAEVIHKPLGSGALVRRIRELLADERS